jgi:upstream activation factor subunit UAF30
MAKATKKKTTTRTAKKSPAKKTAARKPAAKKKPVAKKKPAAKKTSTRKVAAKKTTAKKKSSSKPKAKTKRKPNAAFMKPVNIGTALQPIVGSKPIPRTEVTKKLWNYIKKNGLQDKKNKRNINADDNLKKVFGGRKTVNMFEMTKMVSKYLS